MPVHLMLGRAVKSVDEALKKMAKWIDKYNPTSIMAEYKYDGERC